MIERERKISLSLVRDLLLCERIVWFKLNLSFQEPPTASMELSKKIHETSLERIADELFLPDPLFFNLRLCHPNFPVCGAPDIISGKEKKVIVEFKPFAKESQKYENLKRQLISYGWLVQEVMGGVWKLILYVKDGVEWESDYSYEFHKEALLDVRKLLQLSRSEELPDAERGGKCYYCYFKSVCASPRRSIFF